MNSIHNCKALKHSANEEDLKDMTSVLCVIQASSMIPTDPEEWDHWKKLAKKIIDKESEHLNAIGIERLTLAMVDLVLDQNYSGKSNELVKDDTKGHSGPANFLPYFKDIGSFLMDDLFYTEQDDTFFWVAGYRSGHSNIAEMIEYMTKDCNDLISTLNTDEITLKDIRHWEVLKSRRYKNMIVYYIPNFKKNFKGTKLPKETLKIGKENDWNMSKWVSD